MMGGWDAKVEVVSWVVWLRAPAIWASMIQYIPRQAERGWDVFVLEAEDDGRFSPSMSNFSIKAI